MGRRAVTVVADPPAVDALAPLLDHWRTGPGLRLVPWTGAVAGGRPAVLTELADGADAVLVVGRGSARHAPCCRRPCSPRRTAGSCPRPGCPPRAPTTSPGSPAPPLAVHARAARTASGHDRRRTLAVLGERHPRFDRLAERIVRIGGEGVSDGVEVRRCHGVRAAARRPRRPPRHRSGAGRLRRARPPGRLGRLRRHPRPPLRGCRRRVPATSRRPPWSRSPARRRVGAAPGCPSRESLPLRGVAAATLGAVAPTLHTGNARWALRIARGSAPPPPSASSSPLVAAARPARHHLPPARRPHRARSSTHPRRRRRPHDPIPSRRHHDHRSARFLSGLREELAVAAPDVPGDAASDGPPQTRPRGRLARGARVRRARWSTASASSCPTTRWPRPRPRSTPSPTSS